MSIKLQSHNRRPMAHPHGRAIGCLLRGFGKNWPRNNGTVLYMTPRCINSGWPKWCYFTWIVVPDQNFKFMMTSSNGNIFRVTGHLCGEFTGLRWIPRTKASDAELWCFLWCARLVIWDAIAGDLRRYCIHYDVIVMSRQGHYIENGSAM